SISLIDEKKRIEAILDGIPFLNQFMGPYNSLGRLKREIENGSKDPKILDAYQKLSEYLRVGEAFVKEQAKTRNFEDNAFLIAFCLEAMKDYAFERGKELLESLLLVYGEGEEFLPLEKSMLLYEIVLGHRRGDYPWRAKPYAKQLKELLKEKEGPFQIYLDLSAFYQSVTDHVSASEVALMGAEALLKREPELKHAAQLARNAYSYALAIPDYPFPSEEEIVQKYQQEAKTVLDYPKYLTFRSDPIECSPEFQAAYDEVMEEAMAKYLREEEGRIPHMLWSYMKEGFAEKGIQWKDPQQMNPTMKLD
ncbi:MAG: hypothetical protein J5736_05785, partial [Bacilli bacterium]|nr:hypothetical protein [Bacilli bacterium]